MENTLKITSESAENFARYLRENEKSAATVEKYLRDVRSFIEFLDGRQPDKAAVLEYKTALAENFAVSSANSMIAALNSFLKFAGFYSLCVKQFRVQRSAYCPEEKELTRAEYERLVQTAKTRGKERLALLIQTVCGTGIRVSELEFITIEAAREGRAVVNCKGKTRAVFIVKDLRKKLISYARANGITQGAVFVGRTGKPINRSTVWREMKSLCGDAKVSPGKVFPHNLRHLFARIFYGLEKDIAKLADILGHASINTTRIYIVTTGEEHRRKMESMRLII